MKRYGHSKGKHRGGYYGNRGRGGKKRVKDIDYYINDMNNNQNKNLNNQGEGHNKKHKNNINDIEDYFKVINNDEKIEKNYVKYTADKNIKQYNKEYNNNLFGVKNNKELFKEKKKNYKNNEDEA